MNNGIKGDMRAGQKMSLKMFFMIIKTKIRKF